MRERLQDHIWNFRNAVVPLMPTRQNRRLKFNSGNIAVNKSVLPIYNARTEDITETNVLNDRMYVIHTTVVEIKKTFCSTELFELFERYQ